MLAKVISASLVGLEAVPVTVEVDIASQGLPNFTIVGLPDKAVEEAKERVRSALKNSGCDFPAKRITVNLAPADLPKEGAAFDLPIALGILLASEQIKGDLENGLVLGELSLDGGLRQTCGVLPSVLLAHKLGFEKVFIPQENGAEGAVIDGIKVLPVTNLASLCRHFLGQEEIVRHPPVKPDFSGGIDYEFDFTEIRGQEHAKRALEIAASGGHNVLLKGPPGAGKTMLARALPSILPDLTLEEALELTKIYSVMGLLEAGESLVRRRPFRCPHHTASYVGLVGGSAHPKPGEISLAHRGVLFLDEFGEFSRQVLEAMRQPLEDGKITVSRAAGSLTFPAKFILVAAQNPCPCGYFGDSQKACVCTPSQISRYQKKISGPILDRIDLHVEVPAVKVEKLTGEEIREDSKTIRKRVQKARNAQTKRFKGKNLTCNADMGTKEIRQHCKLENEALALLRQAISQLRLSARAYTRILKVARTIADLEGAENVKTQHLAEALQYRAKEENY